MSEFIKTIYQNPIKDKAISWIRLIAITGSAQITLQAIGFISGILVLRLLPTKEYAFYTLANTMLGTVTILADGGISSGVMAEGGKVWQNKMKLGQVLATGLSLRRQFAVGSLVVSIPVLIYLLIRLEANSMTILLIIASLIPAFLAALSDSLLEIVPKLHQLVLPLQKNQLTVAIWRLVLSTLTLFAFPYVFIAVLAGGLPRIYGNLKLKKIVGEFAELEHLPDPEIKRNILCVVKRILPGAIYYAVSGQITVWLISAFGNVKQVAQIGALGRLAVLIGIFGTVFSVLIQPRFARLPAVKSILLKRIILIQLLLIVISSLLILIAYLFPSEILFILGGQYKQLDHELLLIVISSSLAMVSGTIFQLSSSRGIVPPPFLFISIMIVSQILLIVFLDLSSLQNILLFSIYTYTLAWMSRSCYLLYNIYKMK